MPTLILEDASLHYQFDQTENLPVLVLSNSLGTNLSMWSHQASPFAEHFSLLRYDSRGQGQSSTPAGPYTIATMATDVLHLTDALGIDRFNFCGLSMGGMVGQWLGINAGSRLIKLVLSNTAAKIGSNESWNQRIATVQNEGMQAIVAAVLRGWLTPPFHHEHPEEVARMARMLSANDPAGYTASCAAVRDMDFRSVVSSVRVPSLVISGASDVSTPPAEAEFLVSQIPGARSLQLPTAHIANVEAATRFTDAVLQFLLEVSL